MAPRRRTRRAKVASSPLIIWRVISGFSLSVSSFSNFVADGIGAPVRKFTRKNRVSKPANRQWVRDANRGNTDDGQLCRCAWAADGIGCAGELLSVDCFVRSVFAIACSVVLVRGASTD